MFLNVGSVFLDVDGVFLNVDGVFLDVDGVFLNVDDIDCVVDGSLSKVGRSCLRIESRALYSLSKASIRLLLPLC